MNDLSAQFVSSDIGVRETLTLLGDLTHVNSLIWAVLHTAQAADAVGAEARLSILQTYVAARADLHTDAASNACVIGRELPCPFWMHLGERPAFQSADSVLWRLLPAALPGHHRGGDFHGLAVDPFLCLINRGGRKAESMRHKPDTG